MNDILWGIGAGLVFALSGLTFFGILIGIGELIERFEKWRNK